jgi:8-oxo-dGTP pyrophosphatase MutT (NUDIX family)
MKMFIQEIRAFVVSNQEEQIIKDRFLDFAENNPDCFLRSNLKGHITASAFVVDVVEQKILLIHHKKLNKWLQPGGHCDGDTDTLGVAIKEVYEETGVEILPKNQTIVDLDIHTIPERKGVPEHEHFDVRYIFETDATQPLIQNHETIDLRWIEFKDVPNYTDELSITRVIDKFQLKKP